MEAPQVPEVPLIRHRHPPIEGWTELMYGHKRRVIVWGWFVWLFLIAVTVKVAVYWAVVALICVAWALMIPVDLASYRWRLKRAWFQHWDEHDQLVWKPPSA